MYGLIHASMVHSQCGLYSVAEAETAEEVALGEWKRQSVLDGVRDHCPRLPFGNDRQSLRCIANDNLRARHVAGYGNRNVAAALFVMFGQGLCGSWPIR